MSFNTSKQRFRRGVFAPLIVTTSLVLFVRTAATAQDARTPSFVGADAHAEESGDQGEEHDDRSEISEINARIDRIRDFVNQLFGNDDFYVVKSTVRGHWLIATTRRSHERERRVLWLINYENGDIFPIATRARLGTHTPWPAPLTANDIARIRTHAHEAPRTRDVTESEQDYTYFVDDNTFVVGNTLVACGHESIEVPISGMQRHVDIASLSPARTWALLGASTRDGERHYRAYWALDLTGMRVFTLPDLQTPIERTPWPAHSFSASALLSAQRRYEHTHSLGRAHANNVLRTLALPVEARAEWLLPEVVELGGMVVRLGSETIQTKKELLGVTHNSP